MSKKAASEAGKALSLLGAAKGGKARAEKLSEEERKEIARKGAAARWGSDLPKAIYGSPDRPLRIKGLIDEEDIEIPCYVLDDERRVLSQRGVVSGMGMKRGGREGGDRLTHWIAGKSVSLFVSESLQMAISSPVVFRGVNNVVTHGYEATVLLDICEAVLEARRQGKLYKNQLHIADRCEILVRGLSRVGIIALVDEATGFQYDRARTALEEILESFLKDELGKWAKRFPDDFYRELFRLRGLQFIPFPTKRPRYVGLWTNDLVYKRLAPGVLQELTHKNPPDPRGRRKHKHHQWLTDDIGHPRLQEHLASLITLMRGHDDWESFHKMLDRALPKYKDFPLFPTSEDESEQ